MAGLSREELLDLVRQLVLRIQELEAQIEMKVPPRNSKNSFQPPSRDQKCNPPEGLRKKHGPSFSHERSVRPLVDDPDRIIHARVKQCEYCQHDLSEASVQSTMRRQVTELAEIKPVVIETQQHELICPGCQRPNRAELPSGLEAGRYFGPRLEGAVRVKGRNEWHWVFLGAQADYHHIAPRRNAQVIQDIMGDSTAQVWVSDCFGAQLKARALAFQLCLAHPLRDLQKVLDQKPEEPWALAMQKLFRETIHLKTCAARSFTAKSPMASARTGAPRLRLTYYLSPPLPNSKAAKPSTLSLISWVLPCFSSYD